MKFFTLPSDIKGMTIPYKLSKLIPEIQHHDLIGLTEEQNKKNREFLENKIKRVLTCKWFCFRYLSS